MSAEELSELFDVLFNNITSNQAPGLNEYEKSLFLTKAQDEIIKNYFNPKGNKYGAGFDGNQKRQIDFSSIISVNTINDTEFNDAIFSTNENSRSIVFPSNVWMIINETVDVLRNNNTVRLTVKPISYSEYDRLMSKPFKRPIKYEAWRLINHEFSNKADLIVGPSDTIDKYIIRYIRKPKPIIVGPLDGLTINGYCFTGETTIDNSTEGCKLDPILHEEIVQRAVEIARTVWNDTGQGTAQPLIQIGERSE